MPAHVGAAGIAFEAVADRTRARYGDNVLYCAALATTATPLTGVASS
ncbi:hypothetical protein ABZ341_13910 [Streptomyces sp. NPDC006173]